MEKYINTYLKDEQSLFEIRNCKIDNKFPNDLTNINRPTNNDILEVKLTVDFSKKKLDNQKKINEERCTKLKNFRTKCR